MKRVLDQVEEVRKLHIRKVMSDAAAVARIRQIQQAERNALRKATSQLHKQSSVKRVLCKAVPGAVILLWAAEAHRKGAFAATADSVVGSIPGVSWIQMTIESAAEEELFTSSGINWSVFPKAAENTVVELYDALNNFAIIIHDGKIRRVEDGEEISQVLITEWTPNNPTRQTFCVKEDAPWIFMENGGWVVARSTVERILRSTETDSRGRYWIAIEFKDGRRETFPVVDEEMGVDRIENPHHDPIEFDPVRGFPPLRVIPPPESPPIIELPGKTETPHFPVRPSH